ncbi:MAG TPA: archaellum operon transcriptional activator EarA family protein [Candidatus Thermoplasmatota archaeon]|nr:archaellum operon transcriptional activator EarA family protein [Candidatus Thermoplasmatota archaeon]
MLSLDLIDIVRACRRSRIKTRIFAALVDAEMLLVGELADAAATSPGRVQAAMFGDGDEFSFESALVSLGVTRVRRTPRGLAFEITHVGRAAWPHVQARTPRGRRPARPG